MERQRTLDLRGTPTRKDKEPLTDGGTARHLRFVGEARSQTAVARDDAKRQAYAVHETPSRQGDGPEGPVSPGVSGKDLAAQHGMFSLPQESSAAVDNDLQTTFAVVGKEAG